MDIFSIIILLLYLISFLYWLFFSRQRVIEKFENKTSKIARYLIKNKIPVESYLELKQVYCKNKDNLISLSKEWYLYNILNYLYQTNYNPEDVKWNDDNLADPWLTFEDVKSDYLAIKKHFEMLLTDKPSNPKFITTKNDIKKTP